jgi:hypothetical protein
MGVGGQHHAPATFTPGKDPVPLVQEVGAIAKENHKIVETGSDSNTATQEYTFSMLEAEL